MPYRLISARDGPLASGTKVSSAVLRINRDEARALVEKYEQGKGAEVDSDSEQLLLRYFAENTSEPEDIELSRRLDEALKSAASRSS